MAKKTTVNKLENRARDLEALDLRKHGATFEQIATKLAYADRSHAFKAITNLLNSQEVEAVEDYRKLELMRLDSLELALSPQLQTGNGKSINFGAIDRVLKIMERRAKLLGLDAPTKQEHEHIGEVELGITDAKQRIEHLLTRHLAANATKTDIKPTD